MAKSRVSLEVIGDKELARAFDAAAGDIGPAVDAAEREEGEATARGARSRAPVLRGRLRGSIRASGGTVTAGGVGVPYAGPIHFGWPSRPNPARGWRGGPIAPNPFLFDALDERERHMVDTFGAAVDEATAQVR